MKCRIGRTYKFEAAHCILGHPYCGRMHGHTYKLTVEVEGAPQPPHQMVLDFHELNKLVKELVLDVLDHNNLNLILSHTTAEYIAEWVWNTLAPHLPQLYKVEVQEGEGGYACITKELSKQ